MFVCFSSNSFHFLGSKYIQHVKRVKEIDGTKTLPIKARIKNERDLVTSAFLLKSNKNSRSSPYAKNIGYIGKKCFGNFSLEETSVFILTDDAMWLQHI